MSQPNLSIILPAHNEERRLERCLKLLFNHLYSNKYDRYGFEVIVVANGCTDATVEICKLSQGYYPQLRYYDLKQRGKGLAVRHGMLAATGYWRLMMDVDLSTSLDEIQPALWKAHQGNDIVIGSRKLAPSQVVMTPRRALIGRAFHALVRDLVPGITDTQCGFKLFWQDAAMDLFQYSRLNGMAFDVELLYLARLRSWSVAELPVRWVHDPDSRVRLVGDSLSMLWDVLTLPMLHARDQLKAPA